jgi:hypothetical protein
MKYRVFSHKIHIASKLRGLDTHLDRIYIYRLMKETGTYKCETLMEYTHIDFIYAYFNPILASHIKILSSSSNYSYTLII